MDVQTVLVVMVVQGIVAGVIGELRGNNVARGFALGLFLGPVGIVAMLLQRDEAWVWSKGEVRS